MTTPEELADLRKRLQKAEGQRDKFTRQLGGCKDALERMTASRDCLRRAVVSLMEELEYGEAGQGDQFEIQQCLHDAKRALKESRRHAK